MTLSLLPAHLGNGDKCYRVKWIELACRMSTVTHVHKNAADRESAWPKVREVLQAVWWRRKASAANPNKNKLVAPAGFKPASRS